MEFQTAEPVRLGLSLRCDFQQTARPCSKAVPSLTAPPPDRQIPMEFAQWDLALPQPPIISRTRLRRGNRAANRRDAIRRTGRARAGNGIRAGRSSKNSQRLALRPAKMPTRTATVTTVGIFSRIVIRLSMVGQFILTEAQNRSDLGNLLSSGIRTSGARRFAGKPIEEMTSAHPRICLALGGGVALRQRPTAPRRSYTFALTPKSKSSSIYSLY